MFYHVGKNVFYATWSCIDNQTWFFPLEWKTTMDIIMKTEYNRTKTCDFALGTEEFFLERVKRISDKLKTFCSLSAF